MDARRLKTRWPLLIAPLAVLALQPAPASDLQPELRLLLSGDLGFSSSGVAALFKQVFLGNVQAYLSGGPGRILQYDDEKRAVRPVDDFNALLQRSPYIGALVPGLPEHLREFPARSLPGAEDFLYWSKEKF